MIEKETVGERERVEWYWKKERRIFWVRKREENHFITVPSCPGIANIDNRVDQSKKHTKCL
jgi:hypothetical protein